MRLYLPWSRFTFSILCVVFFFFILPKIGSNFCSLFLIASDNYANSIMPLQLPNFERKRENNHVMIDVRSKIETQRMVGLFFLNFLIQSNHYEQREQIRHDYRLYSFHLRYSDHLSVVDRSFSTHVRVNKSYRRGRYP